MMNLAQIHSSASFMLKALSVAKKALPACRPNPPVGCVLVRDGEIISEGFTQAIGGHHAEVMALAAYTGSLDDVIAYVTLEPCAFVGRTPSCAQVLASSGIKHVVVSMLDPDSRNNGRGIHILREAGIVVDIDIESERVRSFLMPYLGHS
ncbi:bifunctional diaminohydroxyphosphoribosylaminopyrimidine deaminase/5-amino-6-(5-phosphoribosylamino)uracil reductase RibD [Shewanella surugensis]|uniref:Bifunctional diaminohydroxyphosphoribosylaminopyrimidine deaminase/5-amino-6-(5-phosphoribosylamino)uracil reductase RibD n=1 Tax=Shewanella surugensis TaxID=212020 RepID=A0ABT0LKJ0_9GAMM|nr:bifunctional diaminohydroxyphosphoribosylaminopyrimidine deaminase/5-amino-6-(5-phosphoribosylamino)uracil reductase RibD [Shewanella surugensis]MCL1127915.1 bifunctional diaminohydroxyphosphoribosylaminopyrimidine deaminase/5-amino-6-(5-phosphoribosylamino)uracil reductase RibD [Shewanella surugensis]